MVRKNKQTDGPSIAMATDAFETERKTLRRIRLYLGFLAIALSVLVSTSVWWQWTAALDNMVYDQFLQLHSEDPPSDVIVVAIDEYSLSHIGEWPWSRRYHGELINVLTDAGVSAIGYDVVFAERNPMDEAGDLYFKDALVRNGKVVLPVYIDRTQLGGQLIEVMPHPDFAEHVKMGHVNTELDHDGVVRHFYQYEGIGDAFWAHFSTVVAEISEGYQQPQVKQSDKESISPLLYVRQAQKQIPFLGGVGSFQQVSFFDVISGKIPARLFKDRVVFVGATSISLGDLLPTPVTVQGEQMPGVEINATIFNAARQNGFISLAQPIVSLLLSVAVVLFAVLLVPRVVARTSLLFIVLTTVGLFALQALLILGFSYWLPLISAVICLWLVYPLWTVLRLDQTIRYLQKQLVSLREEIGHQSLVEHNMLSNQDAETKIITLMSMVGVKDFQLVVNGECVHALANKSIPLSDFPALQGPNRVADTFYCQYDVNGVFYQIAVPVGDIPDWKEIQEAYITGFFEIELAIPVSRFEGTYDLVFKYLSEVRKSQFEVNQARVLFEYCVNEMNDGVVIADEFGGVLFVNKLALNYLGIDILGKDEQQGDGLLPLLDHLMLKQNEGVWQDLLLDVIANGSSVEVEALGGNQSSLLVNLTYLDVAEHHANLIVINLYDISRIREAQRLRNETIDFLSHDMRSPMVSLLALLNQQRHASGDNAFLQQVEQYASKNLHYAEQFLQLARVESGESIQTFEVDIEAIVQNAIEDVYSQAKEKNIQLVFSPVEDLLWVKGNGELLERAIVNLITNAIKYGPSDSKIEIELKPYGESVMVAVRDYGQGIPKEKQALLFAPYQKANENGKGRIAGAGLGLRFVDITIKRHNGELYFTSQPGRTEFVFTLPRLQLED